MQGFGLGVTAFGVQGFGGVLGLGFRVEGVGFRALGLGCTLW